MAESPERVAAQQAGGAEHQLILAIVQDEDAGPVIEALTKVGFRATRINTVGGFLRTNAHDKPGESDCSKYQAKSHRIPPARIILSHVASGFSRTSA